MHRRPTTHLRTRRALIILDCQNAFLSPSPNPLAPPSYQVESIPSTLSPLLSAFREVGDEVIWVNTQFEGTWESGRRDGVFVDDDDEEVPKEEVKKEVKKVVNGNKANGNGNGNKANANGNKANGNANGNKAGPSRTNGHSYRRVPLKKGMVAGKYKDMVSDLLKGYDESDSDGDNGTNGTNGTPKEKKEDEVKEDPGSNTDEYLSEEFTKLYSSFWKEPDVYKTYPDYIKSLIVPSDKQYTKSSYSAFHIPNFLGILRSRMVTEIYFAGAHSNVGVFATVADGAMHGFVMTVVEDWEEVSGTGRIRNPTLDPEVVEALMEKLKVGSTTEEDEEESKKAKRNSRIGDGGKTVNGAGRVIASGSSRVAQRESLKTPEQLFGNFATTGVQRPNSAPVSGFQFSAPELLERKKEEGASSSPTSSLSSESVIERTSIFQRPYSMDATKLEDQDEEICVREFKRNVRPRVSRPAASAPGPASSSSPSSATSGPVPRERVRAKVTMRRPTDKKGRPVSPDKPGISNSGKLEIARAMSSLSISTISSGEAEKSQAAKDELLKSIMTKKTEPSTSLPSLPIVAPETTLASSSSKSPAAEVETKAVGAGGAKAEDVEATKEAAVGEEKTGEVAGTPEKASEQPVKDQVDNVENHSTKPHEESIKTPPLATSSMLSPPVSSTASVDSASSPSKEISKDTMPSSDSEASAPSPGDNTIENPPLKQDSVDQQAHVEQPPAESSTTTTKTTTAASDPGPSTASASQEPPADAAAPQSTHKARKQKRKDANHSAALGPNDTLGEPTDTTSLITSLLPADFSASVFAQLKSEVQWRVMYHRGGEVPRLVAVQGQIDEDGSFPIYRHPSDESPPLLPFSRTVEEIRKHVEARLGHKVNHVLIQLYRTGTDYISEHSDKTLDIVKGSGIVNVSLGAQRVMTLRTKKREREKLVPHVQDDTKKDEPEPRAELEPTKKNPKVAEDSPTSTPSKVEEEPEEPRIIQKIPLPHNSMFILGLPTNQKWMHSIQPDKRLLRDKSPEELAYSGERISLTFRHIGTFLSKDEKKIWGQGATAKNKEDAKDTIVGDQKKAEEMVFAFAAENRMGAGFEWDEWYGKGFDVLHFKEQRRKIRVLKGDPGCLGVRIAMEVVGWKDVVVEEVGIEQVKGMEVAGGLRGDLPVLEDVDRDRTVVVGEEAVLMFLATAVDEGIKWLLPNLVTRRAEYARCLSGLMEVRRLKAAMEVLAVVSAGSVVVEHPLFEKVHEELQYWDAWYSPKKESVSSETEGVGSRVTVVDCAVFPYVKRLREFGFLDVKEKDGAGARYDNLVKFVKRFEKEKFVKAVDKTVA
ncbi:hypothetical protein TWF970_008729 [Orbilia oligospora]|uniref:Fe2OG dioxygenase domain-containing protein n=1 Tax=Orbilia oligospora TaxID=2813651 RepID=A0A7C8VP06_ORBOL|nr:hypothetical protein TWF970_008729 [Orbilia oligospora]